MNFFRKDFVSQFKAQILVGLALVLILGLFTAL